MKTNKLYILILLVLSIFFSQSLLAQKGKLKAHQRYLEAETLYVLNSGMNTQEFTCSNGEEITFLESVKNAWPDKTVELISKDDYLNQDDLEGKFHITIFERSIAVGSSSGAGSTVTSVQYGISVKEGGIELGEGKVITFVWIDFEGIENNILAERLEYSVNGLRSILDDFQSNIHSSSGVYQVKDCEKTLGEKTIILRESLLHKSLKDGEKLKSILDFKFEIVSDDEWKMAIMNKKPNCVFIDYAQGGRFTGINVFTTDGDLLITSYPWMGHKFTMDKKFFQEVFDF